MTVIISCVADDTAQVCTGTVPLTGNAALVIAVGNGSGLDLAGNAASVAACPVEFHTSGITAADDAAAGTLSRDTARILAAGGNGRRIQAIFNRTGAEARDAAHLTGAADRTVSDETVAPEDSSEKSPSLLPPEMARVTLCPPPSKLPLKGCP